MSGIRILQLRLMLLHALVVPLGWLFWRLEQARIRAQTALENERSGDARD